MWRNCKVYAMGVGMCVSATTVETSSEVPQKLTIELAGREFPGG